MAIRVDKFDLGKGTSLKELNRQLLENKVRSADIISVVANPLGTDKGEYIVMREDSSAPRVIATIPTDGSNVAPGTSLIVIFSEPMQTIFKGDIEIFDINGAALIDEADFTLDNTLIGQSRGVLVIEDSGGYQENGKVYRVTIKTTVSDLDGNLMEEPYDFIFTVNTSQASLDFDGGIVPISSFSSPYLNRWEVLVTPVRLSLTPSTLVELTFEGPSGVEIAELNLHVEKLGASFRIAIDHDYQNQVPEPTGILPTGISVQWKATKGL